VPDALISHIFTPFFSTKEKGGGIGLAIVRQLAHGTGGTVRYRKSVSGGARFIVTFRSNSFRTHFSVWSTVLND